VQLFALLAALALLPAAKCVLSSRMVADAFNEGAIDTSGGDPFRDPADVARDVVAVRIQSELIDGYFHMGPVRSRVDVARWMRRVSHDVGPFYRLVVEVACEQNARVGEKCPERRRPRSAPPYVQDSDQAAEEARERVIRYAGDWADAPPKRSVCRRKGERDDEALMHFVDFLRFTVAVERAVYETAEILIEGVVDREAVHEGARRAFVQAADYFEQRAWSRQLDHHTTGLVVKGGAATGIFSAGVVWVTLNVIHRYIEHSRCETSGAGCPRFDLVSGTSTGAFVAVAVDRFATASEASQREAVLQKIIEWFTCFGLNDMYCVQERPLTNLASDENPLQGVLRFDGLRRILDHEIADAEMCNRTELVLNTVDFRSGSLFALSDQDRRQLRGKGDVVNGVLASAVLPLIVEPIPHLPVNPTEGEVAVYLDGGIRSELPVMPLVQRGAERVLVASSSGSVLGQTKRLENALSIAARYIDISTGAITEGELAHAKRRVESVRLAEAIQCRDMLWRNRPSEQRDLDFTALCPKGGDCNRAALCAARYRPSELCAEGDDDADDDPSPAMTTKTSGHLAPRLQIRRLWNMVGIFRDERTVDAVHGYDFNPDDQRRLFLAGAEAARRRCIEIGELLGIDTSDRDLRASLVGWCTRALPQEACSCYKEARGKLSPGIRSCDDDDAEVAVERILASCSKPETRSCKGDR
jgi:predicted acylesterase/phospholipase RssA